jgi:serine/threonine kinase PknH
VTEGLPVDEVEFGEFGRYRLLSLLGEGGMGEVWRAHDTVTDREVAIKLLPPKLSKDEDFQQRFRREAHAAARLNTPHAVPIYDYGEIDGRLFVSMRLVEGRDLATVLAGGPMEPTRAVRVIEGVALALHAAHQVGLLHRDVKPSNILLDDNDFAYLIDFGIAHAADDTRMTKTGNTIGTFAYIAPERLDRQGTEDARVDIYSLACVLYECLTGEPPFTDDTTPRLIVAHLSEPPPRPSITRPDVPAEVDEVIATGMAKAPDERYATTVELATAAHDAITGPIGLRAQDRATRAAFIAPAAQNVPAAETADLNLDTTQPGVGAPETSTPAKKPGGPPRGRSAVIAAIIAAVVILVAGFVIFRISRPQQSSQPPASAAVSTPQPAAPAPAPPPKLVEEAALDGLLLSPDQVSAVMGRTMVVTEAPTAMEDNSAHIVDKACRPIDGPLETPVYAGSGFSASREQALDLSGGNTHLVDQGVVVFPSAQAAAAFYAASAQEWSACSNRQYTRTAGGGESYQVQAAGPVSNTNGTLSVTKTQVSPQGSADWSCQRALTVANNVAIDVQVCAHHNPDDSAVNIAHQIAAKVPT